ncbi:MAG: tetratricopeptide repeat protein [Planctomycetes bacterium]|nr:tetratricopeptide repeat protein [Planctomycetota bacterium]
MPARLLASSLVFGIALSGCQQPAQPGATNASAIDRRKAFLSLDEIQPRPSLPRGASVPASQPSDSAAKSLVRARELIAEQLWTEAMAACERALRDDPNSTEAHVLLSRAALRQGNQALAESHLNETLRLDPRSVAAYQMLGDIALRDNKTTEAIAQFRLALLASGASSPTPERVLAHFSLATSLRKEGYLTAALGQWEAFKAAAKSPTPEMLDHRELAELFILFKSKLPDLIGEIQTELGRHDLAAKTYEEALADAPATPGLRVRLARSLAKAGRADAAMEQVRQILLNAPDAAENLTLLKEICDETRRPEQYDAYLAELARNATNAAIRIKLAELLIERKQDDAARDVLTALVAADPTDAKANRLLFTLRLSRGEVREAMDAAAKLLHEDTTAYDELHLVIAGDASRPFRAKMLEESAILTQERGSDAAVWFLRGELQRLTGDLKGAVDSFQAATKLQRTFGPAWAALAQIHADRREWQEAIETANKAIKANAADSQTYLCKGKAHLTLDETDDAETALLEAFRLDPKSPEPLFLLAAEAERRGEKRKCEQLFKRILDDVDPRHIPSRERLVRLYLNTDKMEKARDYFSDFERLGQTGAAVERCAAMLKLATSQNTSAQGRIDEYRSDLNRIAEKYPTDSATRVDLAMSHILVLDYESAIKEVDAALKVNPADPRARELRGTLLMKLLDYEGAATVFRELLAEHPRDLNLLRNQLDLAINLADWSEAIRLLDALMVREDLRGGREAFMRQAIDYLILSERFDEAVERAKKWLDDNPTDATRRQAYLTALRAAKRPADGIAAASRWLADDPTNAEVRLIYIDQLMQAERYLEAEQKVLSWMQRTPDDLNLNGLLITLAWRGKHWDRAIELAKTGAEITENRPAYLASLGRTLRLAGRFDEAIDFYRGRMKSAGNEAAFDELVATQMAAERWKDAEQTIQSLLAPQIARIKAGEQVDPLLVIRLRRQLANVFQLAGRDHASMEQLEEVFKIAPSDPGINNDLGYTWIDADMNMEQAEKMIRLAVRERPREAAYLDSLGWLYYKQGKNREAIVYLERSIRMGETTDAVLFDHLGDALYRDGRKDEAAKRWRKSLDLLNAQTEGLEGIQNRKIRPRVEAKLRQFEAMEPVDVAPVLGKAATTQPTGR